MRRADRKRRRSYWGLVIIPIAVIVFMVGIVSAGGPPSEALQGLTETLSAMLAAFQAFLAAILP